MAPADDLSTPATDVPDSSPSQSTSNTLATSLRRPNDANDLPNESSIPMKSLFGPFPPAEDQSQADQPTGNNVEMMQAPVVPISDQIEPTGLNKQQPANQSPLNPHQSIQEPPPSSRSTQPINDPTLPPLAREKTAPAIGPATDKPTPLTKESETEGPALLITLLLSSTGARHPYKLDEKYLRKRNVVVEGNNPINLSLYKLKELILRDWREGENEPIPSV